MKEEIIKHNPSSEFYSDNERCHITELYNLHKDENLSIAKARVEKGVSTAFHSLKDVDEKYVILLGQGIVEVGELPPTEVTFGDVVCIPAGTKQRITNTGNSDLIFLCICTPRFKKELYVDLENHA